MVNIPPTFVKALQITRFTELSLLCCKELKSKNEGFECLELIQVLLSALSDWFVWLASAFQRLPVDGGFIFSSSDISQRLIWFAGMIKGRKLLLLALIACCLQIWDLYR